MKKALVLLLTLFVLAGGAVYGYRQGFFDRWAPRTVMAPQPTPAAPAIPAAHAPSGAPVPASEAGAPAASDAVGAPLPAEASAVSGPFTNIAASTVGGHIVRMTGEFGPGYFGRRLIDGSAASTWKLEPPVRFPQEIVFSFYEREPALVSSVVVSVPGKGAPADIEIWTSSESATAGFVKAASQTLPAGTVEHGIPIEPVEARYVKLIVKSDTTADALEIGEVQVMEPQRSGYTSLLHRNPRIARYMRSPRQAAQLGIEWLQPAAVNWQRRAKCYGCHVQTQAIMGLSVARGYKYLVSQEAVQELVDFTRDAPLHMDGSYWGGGFGLLHGQKETLTGGGSSATQFAVMGFAHFDDVEQAKGDKTFIRALDYLLAKKQKPDGEIPEDHGHPPITQGGLMTTTNTVTALMKAHKDTGETRYKEAAERGLGWIASAPLKSTQDEVFKLLALSRYGRPEQQAVVNQLVERLKKEQRADGGWAEYVEEPPRGKGSNAFATGQVLYAFKQAGVPVQSREFARGVRFLIDTQKETGAWPVMNTWSSNPSEFAPSMWAVIGLAGAYSEEPLGTLQVTSSIQRSERSRNLQIVLDASGSMKLALQGTTRWATALKVFNQVVAKLPEDLNVGLRVYGHRAPAKSKETCQDTELVVPVGKLDRARLLSVVTALKPRGETPLVFSALQTPGDLKALGGGTVILITDGEESCGGNPATAADQLKAAGVDVTMNIVGFTLAGKRVQEQLSAFAESTGGRYYGAQSGEELARAILIAATDRFPYTVTDAKARVVTQGESGATPDELPPGTYQLVVQAADQKLVQDLTITADKQISFTVLLKDGRFVLERTER
jgi:hypothetical protein